jgi:hypothetical protein
VVGPRSCYAAGPCCSAWPAPMRPGEPISLTVSILDRQRITILEVVMRWSRGQAFAVENVVIEPHTLAHLAHYVKRLVPQSPTGCSCLPDRRHAARERQLLPSQLQHTAQTQSQCAVPARGGTPTQVRYLLLFNTYRYRIQRPIHCWRTAQGRAARCSEISGSPSTDRKTH